MNKLDAQLINDLNQESYSTYRRLSEDIGKYALVGNIKHKIENDLNIYPIYSLFKVSVSGGSNYDEALYALRIYYDNGLKIRLICLNNSDNVNFCIDDKTSELNLYVSTTITGGIVTITEIDKTGFIFWKNFNKFTMTEQSFTKKVSASNNNFTRYSSILIDSESVSRPFLLKRMISGATNWLVNFIDNTGKVIIGKHNDNENYGDYISSIQFSDNEIILQMPAGGTINPSRDASFHLGGTSKKFRTLHLNDGVICSRTTAPADVYNGLSFFHATSKKWVTYYNGSWYCNGEQITI